MKRRRDMALVEACEADLLDRDDRVAQVADEYARSVELIRTTSEFTKRAIVCPDTGEAYRSASVAVTVMRRREKRKACAEMIYRAIRLGRRYADRFWDYRFPEGWDEVAMWERLERRGVEIEVANGVFRAAAQGGSLSDDSFAKSD